MRHPLVGREGVVSFHFTQGLIGSLLIEEKNGFIGRQLLEKFYRRMLSFGDSVIRCCPLTLL